MKTIAEYYEDVEKRVDEMRLNVHLHAHEYGVIQEFIASLGRSDDYQGTYLQLGYETNSIYGVIVQVHLKKDESFKAASPIIDYLLERGWKQHDQSDTADWGCRTIEFRKRHPDPPLFWPSHKEWKGKDIGCAVRIWLNAESQICKKVEDGVEPKYKFVCQEA